MFVNIGRNRTVLFIRRTLIFIPSPTGVTLVGVKTIGVAINIPQVEIDFSNQGLSTDDVNAILVDTLINYPDQELTWRVLNLIGNDPITDEDSYNTLIANGWIIYGDTVFGSITFKSISAVDTTFAVTYVGTDDPIWSDGINTFQPVKVSNVSTVIFPWTNNTEKTVTIIVDDESLIYGLSETEFINKDLTYVNLSKCIKYRLTMNFHTNQYLKTFLAPATISRMPIYKGMHIYGCDLTGTLDLSMFKGGERITYSFGSNINLTKFIQPAVFDETDSFHCSNTGLLSLDISDIGMEEPGTRRFNMSNCPDLLTFTPQTVLTGRVQSLDALKGDTAVLVDLDLSKFNGAVECYINKDKSGSSSDKPSVLTIKLANLYKLFLYVGNLPNATMDVSGMILNPRQVYIQDMESVTSLDWQTLNPTGATQIGASRIQRLPSLTGTLDLSWYRANGGIAVTDCPLVTGLIMPNGLTGGYGSNAFYGFNTGFYIDFTIWPRVNKQASRYLVVNENNMTADIVNHILVDLYAHVASEAPGGDLLGRTISIGGNNAAPDSTSGGYDGTQAVIDLIGKGFVVNHS